MIMNVRTQEAESGLGHITDRLDYRTLSPTRRKLFDKYSSFLCEENISMWSRRNTFINIAIHSRSLITVVEATGVSNNLSGEWTRVRMDGGDSTTVSKLSQHQAQSLFSTYMEEEMNSLLYFTVLIYKSHSVGQEHRYFSQSVAQPCFGTQLWLNYLSH